MIKIITNDKFFPDLKKDIHYISWTPFNPMSVTNYSKMSWVDPIVSKEVSDEQALKFYHSIDRNNETGTLFPFANITIMPSSRQPYSDEDIYRHFNDSIKAQIEYIQAKNMIFDMRNYDYINPHTGQVDNDEYVHMIDHNSILIRIMQKEDINIYIVMSKKDVEKIYTVPIQIASDDEVGAMMLKTI